tara:strand:+ start:2468 stop:4114 length:1647 start_codon:yes stop_codon:yes gene_type:complete
MKYFVSDKKVLPNKHGKWYWYADKDCKTYKDNKHLVIYSGYVISKESIDDIVARDPHELEQANGTFWAVILTNDTAKAIVDYFCQTKVFYRKTKDCVEFTNAIYLFPFTKNDLDMQDLSKKLSMLEKEKLQYQPKEQFERWEDMIIDPASAMAMTDAEVKAKELKKYYVAGKFYPDMKQYSKAMCTTMFKDTWILEPDHVLDINQNNINIRRIHFTYDEIIDACKSEPEFKTSEALEDFIHECMQDHADIIKKNYGNIVSSVSEGIDSVMQDAYFPEARKIMYSYKPTNAPFEYKQKIVDRVKAQGSFCRVDHVDISTENIAKMTKDYVNDPTTFYWDCIPTHWQLQQLASKPKIVLYGQCGDQVFLHKAFFYYEYMFAKQIEKDLSAEGKLLEFNKTLSELDDCYSGRDNIWQGNKAKTWQDCFYNTTKEELLHELDSGTKDDWMHDFAKKVTPAPYNREISHCADVLVTSLFCDRRFFYKVMNAPEDILLDNVKHATTQKNILKRKFDIEFETPYKDQAELNAVGMRNPLYTDVVRKCLKDYLPEA